MANYKKSFNFRNGVQVDDSNFIVNANGLVGIGTSLPTEFLDVRGNIVSSGVVTTKNVYATGVSTFKDNVLIGSGVTVFSSLGIVSATSFRGDGSLLDNISGSKWRVDPVAGLTTTSDVGIGTTDPRYRFQVGQDPTPPVGTNEGGVGIDSTGQAYFTGIVTSNNGYATVGFVTAGNLTITGVSTFEGAIDANGTLDVDGDTQLDDLNVSGVATFSSGVDINGSLDVDGDLQVDDLNVAGVSTFSSTVDINSGVTISSTLDVDGQTDLDVLNVSELATFSNNIDANGTLDVDGDTQLDDLNVAGVATFTSAIDANEYVNIDTNLYVAGIATYNNTLYATQLLEAKVGLGISAYDQLKVASFNSGTSGLSSYYGAIKYGNESGGAPYSSRKSLDLINYDSGNVNFYVNANNLSDANHTTGNFHWHRGFNNDRLMTITGIGGSVGIAKTLPEAQLDVVGTGKFSGAVTISNDLTVTGDCSVGGSASFDLTGDLTGSVLGTVGVNTSFINTLVTAGVSTFYRLEIPITRGGIGVGTTTNENLLCCNNTQSDRVFIDQNGAIGIGTDLIIGTGDASTNSSDLGVFLNKDVRTTKAISVGGTARCAVDFSDAVNCSNEGGGVPYLRAEFGYMIPPRVTTVQRNAFKDKRSLSTTLLDGSLIYNTNTERLEMYKGGGWCGIATVV